MSPRRSWKRFQIPSRHRRQKKKRKEENKAEELQGSEPKLKKKKTVSGERVEAESDGKDADEELFRVLIGGLPATVDEKVLRKHFKACGKIKGVKLVQDSRLRFRGVAFVTFASQEAVDAALALDGCELAGKVINVKKALPVSSKLEENKPVGTALQVCVGSLPGEADEETLRKDFEECGKIEKFRMLFDRSSGKPRFKGTAFIKYKKQAGVDAAFKYDGTEYGGRKITVRPALPKNRGKPDSSNP